jgi:hypothetical protein
MSTPTIKPLYGHQEGAVVGYNPRKPGGAHCYHAYMLSDLRLALRVEVHRGDQHNPGHAAAGLWSLLAPLGRERGPRLLRGDAEWATKSPIQVRIALRSTARQNANFINLWCSSDAMRVGAPSFSWRRSSIGA